ncbi:hypothetical protein DMUE_0100 [Dictyocoela muelleri]|nr:hypothetical protein DMUE_0100 [Dictyocoela muelleri]
MSSLKFDINDAISAYDKKIDNIDYSKRNIDEPELKIVENDVERSFQFLGKNEEKKKMKEILQEVLINLSIPYIQGMSEVVSVIVYFFCGEKDDLEWKSADISIIESISSNLSDRVSDRSGKENVDDNEVEKDDDENILKSKAERKLRKKKRSLRKKSNKNFKTEKLESGVSIRHLDNGKNISYNPNDPLNTEFIEKLAVISTNILKFKYLPLIDDSFKIYLKNNKIFLKMMEKRGKTIQTEVSLKYMNDTLTWFTRKCKNVSDMFTLFSIFISCPTSFPFLVLTLFYDDIESGSNITLEDDLLNQLIDLESEFLGIQSEEIEMNSGLNLWSYMLIGGVIVVGLAFAIAGYKKKDQ